MKILKILRKIIFFAFILLLLAGITAGGYVGYKGYGMYRDAIGKEGLTEKVESIRSIPEYTEIKELPQIYQDAVIAVEDHRFYRHPGIDLLAISRALYHDIKAGAYVEGGSTITQQLAKNLYFSQEKKVERKAAEVFMAFAIEWKYTKEEILELYCNSIYFGSGYYCIRDASRGYFQKEPSEMNDYESTMLAGIPNAPSAYALDDHPQLASQRQKQVLKRMVKFKFLTEEEAERIVEK